MKNGDHGVALKDDHNNNKVHTQTIPPTTTSALQLEADQSLPPPAPLRQSVAVASIAAGVCFVWALQLSLLTPYVQLLGIPHIWATFMWLCGPVSGMFVQPIVGYYSDRSTSRFGRRSPFIVVGTALISVAVFFIGYSADLGHRFGDPSGPKTTKPRAIVVFIFGFWVLDVANNMVQGPCRAFLADLAGNSQKRMRTANVFFSLFMSLGSILGYAAGSYGSLYRMFPFTRTHACDVYCANLKTCFFLAVFMLVSLSTIALTTVREKQFAPPKAEAEADGKKKKPIPFFGEIFGALKELPRSMWMVLLVTCLNWIGFFPFLLYDTDWMGREVYGGKIGEGKMYDHGVRVGALALMLNSAVSGATALIIEYVARGGGGGRKLWSCGNFLLAACLAMTVLVTKMADSTRRYPAVGGGGGDPLPPPTGVTGSAIALFAVFGIAFAVTSIVPYALAAIFSSNSNSGQGLSMGVLNLAVVVPQMLVSIVSGPWDALFGGGNLPAFILGAVAAAAAGICALTVIPPPPPQAQSKASTVIVGSH